MSLNGEIALVTGASRGIGTAIALELGRRGATVVGTATASEGAERIGNALKENNIKGRGVVLNVTDPAVIENVIADLEKSVGSPTILVNNAGITRDDLLLRMTEEQWDTVMDTNLKSVYRMTKACLRPMTRARKGRIISVSSVVSATGNPGQTNYAAAKAGIIGFTRALAREIGSRNITVNAVAPGFIDTDMTRALPQEARDGLLKLIPLGRLGLVQDIAHAVAFLASPQAAYITGTTLHVNGGMYMG
ncbi:MAG: 3-oxoacyl-ACP reductase [Candidatus Muproteobacteria bacterium RIFCSPHIGHO2_01_FULL_65_16]|uniref:3-oxoacyl-[acyl-carrier-protein] reductase n=3 Tax=Candidatus Muproteobacteria TaxID=1817795 RepID=A0A1F6TG78_9PROT|nr:MAG: 3-oxoacyl-ACP reductase [Candidatus Muproteobacteria bacterium RBG_16_65_31]OGI47481.1 MAG: 3-oxoacyl-ACP reductase [Candidatus Muproteobacteria bacterium RIFCSPHIGHO2_01_FULL_65_16]OGI51584.1 MAG: 3-oxoacyl-ACP reductase [Candidatus Muproteobacteria bacterium RIFCSPHIGHO2_02_FULL_65_16]